MAGKRDFTCVVDTTAASVLHLNLEIVAPILSHLNIKIIESIFRQRKHLIDQVMNWQYEVNNKISGSFYTPSTIVNDNPLTEIKEKNCT